MSYEIKLDNRNGNVWDISSLVSDATWKTTRIGSPASLDITFLTGALYQSREFTFGNGDVIRLRKNEVDLFYGYIFSIDRGRDEEVKIKAYDQIRYLMNNDTYFFTNVTATQVIQRIAEDCELKTGGLEDTGHVIPTMYEENKKLLDIIYKAMDLTLVANLGLYVFYDDFGSLRLRNITNWSVDLVLGPESLLYDYSYSTSIDSDTYNRVKVVQDNKQANTKEVYIAQDSANIARWGRLQLFEKADDNFNEAQIKNLLDRLIRLRNRETKTLKLDALGDLRVRAGCMLPVIIEDLGIRTQFLVEDCTHQLQGADHTMSLNLKVIE